MNQMKSHKIQSILTFIYIFLIPFTAVLYHCLLTTPAFQKHFPMETVQPYLSFFFNLLMVLCLLSFISIIIIYICHALFHIGQHFLYTGTFFCYLYFL